MYQVLVQRNAMGQEGVEGQYKSLTIDGHLKHLFFVAAAAAHVVLLLLPLWG